MKLHGVRNSIVYLISMFLLLVLIILGARETDPATLQDLPLWLVLLINSPKIGFVATLFLFPYALYFERNNYLHLSADGIVEVKKGRKTLYEWSSVQVIIWRWLYYSAICIIVMDSHGTVRRFRYRNAKRTRAYIGNFKKILDPNSVR